MNTLINATLNPFVGICIGPACSRRILMGHTRTSLTGPRRLA